MTGRKTHLNHGTGVVITGAASGIGKMTAMNLARRGVNLYLIDISNDVAEVAHICNLISEVNGHQPQVYFERCDVSDRVQVRDAIDTAAVVLGGIDIAFVNAGIAKPVALRGDIEVADKIMAVNYGGAQNVADACLPYIEQSKGYFLFNASMGAIVLLALMATAYGTSKAAVAALGQGINLHLKGTGARSGVLFLAEHNTPMEREFEDEAVKILFEDNPRLERAHRKRDPRKALAAVIWAMENRPLYVHAPRYTRLGRYFPAIPNWIVRNYLVQNPQRALEVLRKRYS